MIPEKRNALTVILSACETYGKHRPEVGQCSPSTLFRGVPHGGTGRRSHDAVGVEFDGGV